jgi:hypothetical protein
VLEVKDEDNTGLGEVKMKRKAYVRMPAIALDKNAVWEWELVNPEGVVKTESMRVTPHLSSLEGKTVMLRWNGKHNGDRFLNRIAELLVRQVNKVKIIKSWEVAPETATSSKSQEKSGMFVTKLAGFKPDIVIASQGD